MFSIAFVPVVLFCIGMGIALYRLAFVVPPMGRLIESYLESCAYSTSNPFHGFLCIVEPFFLDLVSNDIGKSFLTVFGTAGMVMSTHLYIKGGHGGGSVLFSPLITIAHGLAGQAFGAGIVGPIVLPTLLAFSKILEPPNAPPPTPPTYTYTVSVLVMQFSVFLISTTLTSLPTTHVNWPYINYIFQGFPLLFLPLAFFARGLTTPKQPHPPPTLSTTVFTVYKYLYAPLWWITLARGLNAHFRTQVEFSLPCYFMALDFSGFVLTFVGMYAVDVIAGDAPATMRGTELLVRMILAGPASAMAAYYEAKEGLVVEHVEREFKRKA
ncbi:hypothetical protein C8R43DRAFT_968888 [Mycena crocata]|nr:hypothetical protein C8R43DRAFT_968888 [Mycena crocata]